MRIAALLAALLAFGACEGRAPAPDVVDTTPALAVAAVVDGEVIPLKELEALVTERSGGRTLTAAEQRRLMRTVLNTRIEELLVDAALRDAGIPAAAGLEALLDRVEPIHVDPGAVERVYHLEHGDEASPQEVRFSMILLRLPPDAGAVLEDRVRKNLQRVLRRIEGAMTFEEAAKEFSQDPTRELEGQREFTEVHRLEPLLRAAIEAAEVGKITGPVRTAEGWVLLRVDGRRTEMNMEIGARKAAIHRRLLMGQAAERREKFLKRLLEEATVEVAEALR